MWDPELAEGDGGWGHFATSLGKPADLDNATIQIPQLEAKLSKNKFLM